MPADVEERAQHALAVADEQHGEVADARRVEGRRLRDLVDACDVLPEAPEDALVLKPEDRRVDVQLHGTSACS